MNPPGAGAHWHTATKAAIANRITVLFILNLLVSLAKFYCADGPAKNASFILKNALRRWTGRECSSGKEKEEA